MALHRASDGPNSSPAPFDGARYLALSGVVRGRRRRQTVTSQRHLMHGRHTMAAYHMPGRTTSSTQTAHVAAVPRTSTSGGISGYVAPGGAVAC